MHLKQRSGEIKKEDLKREEKEKRAKEKELISEKEKESQRNKEIKESFYTKEGDIKRAMYKEAYLNTNYLYITLYGIFSS